MLFGRSTDFTTATKRSSAWGVSLVAMPESDARIDDPSLQSWRFREGKSSDQMLRLGWP